mgnify:CR=1 FL=1
MDPLAFGLGGVGAAVGLGMLNKKKKKLGAGMNKLFPGGALGAALSVWYAHHDDEIITLSPDAGE